MSQNDGKFPDEQAKEDIAQDVSRRLLMKYQAAGGENTGELTPANLPTFTSLD
jgi:hypothetical protein